MSDDELDQLSKDGVRRAAMARNALWLTIAGLVINVIGATTFWVSLPEKLRSTSAQLADHETRIRATEARGSTQEATFVRIDERTKSIQDSVTDLKTAVRDLKHSP